MELIWVDEQLCLGELVREAWIGLKRSHFLFLDQRDFHSPPGLLDPFGVLGSMVI